MDLFLIEVTKIPGVGPARAKGLARLQIHSVGDLLFYVPFRYEAVQRGSDAFSQGAKLVLEAVVCGTATVKIQGKRSTVSVPVQVGERMIQALFFNQTFLRHQLTIGKQIRLYGKYQEQGQKLIVNRYEWIKTETTAGEYIPIYRVTKDLSNSVLRTILQSALRVYTPMISDTMPINLRTRFKLLPLAEALLCAHQPKSVQDIRQARRRLVFEEFLRFQLQIQSYRRLRKQTQQAALDLQQLTEAVALFTKQLPFVLTAGQEQAIAQLLPELASDQPMHRLLQGDVGSGKTVVAFAAIAAVAMLGWQSAYMVPTGILALQQFEVAKTFFAPLGLRVALLTGGQDTAKRQQILQELASGDVALVIGTHVLSLDEVNFHRLRLVVTDEQQRFGVNTRKLLRRQGFLPDVLQMTATPIPRTLALTLFGDIEVTSLRDMPPLRKPIQTLWVSPQKEDKVLQMLRSELAKGRQCYIVAPRIDPDEEDEVASAKQLYEKLSEELAAFSVGLLHGGLPERERMEVMRRFAAGEIAALIATTMIEVGVSVQNATMMVIYNADRFGLATLHQLRGRVGRGTYSARCILIADPLTETARARLEAMVQTQDGFELAQQDLVLRGPGELLGERQSGLPVFRAGDLFRDRKAMEVARQVASELLSSEEFWLLPEYRELRSEALVGLDAYLDS
ncbi:ATP-dependent DNA helicase RecG [Sulfoacidibacillus thermotolerans]|uniref:ATP-dependent DNA helicase RecG n=1 Tax=Sulfoacidibacillus thermotolerans TaxID=1765684 RepID=A0A2U3D7U4_SULT2|nr:ATP-dependent DNA helicase RecG [Sulfoacidibacillus thermotolerans]PWI57343.1 ATP-dependent DNA helicase RecG [Sulfoacidibacillus thermotolerans]